MKKPFIVLLVVLALMATACSSEADEEVGLATLEAAGEDSIAIAEGTADADVDAEEALLAFSECMRDNGFPEYPDPTLNSDGTIGFGFSRGGLEDSGIDPRSEEFRTAREICGENLEGLALGRGGEGFDQTELTDTLLAFAQCMRDHGVTMDDPDLSGFGPGQGGEPGQGGGPFGDIDFEDPEVQEAFEACQEEVNFTGPGGGGFGGGGRPGGGEGE